MEKVTSKTRIKYLARLIQNTELAKAIQDDCAAFRAALGDDAVRAIHPPGSDFNVYDCMGNLKNEAYKSGRTDRAWTVTNSARRVARRMLIDGGEPYDGNTMFNEFCDACHSLGITKYHVAAVGKEKGVYLFRYFDDEGRGEVTVEERLCIDRVAEAAIKFLNRMRDWSSDFGPKIGFKSEKEHAFRNVAVAAVNRLIDAGLISNNGLKETQSASFENPEPFKFVGEKLHVIAQDVSFDEVRVEVRHGEIARPGRHKYAFSFFVTFEFDEPYIQTHRDGKFSGFVNNYRPAFPRKMIPKFAATHVTPNGFVDRGRCL